MLHPQLVILLFLMWTTFALSTYAPAPAPISKVITVNLNGGADYKTIQDAINAVPDDNSEWIKIHVAAGIYREKVNISRTKGNIFLEGEGAENTSIEWGDYYGDPAGHTTANCATFTCNTDNFVASRIAFKNTYDGKASGVKQAVAAAIVGDKAALYNCSFFGVQDTLYDADGRHYYKDCYIEGIIDFIFGDATSLYEGCTISTVEVDAISVPGFITANSRNSANDTSAYVFKNCNVTGSHMAILGRAWRVYARVIFYQTFMSDIVVPQGWYNWNVPNNEEYKITFAESDCSGPGSNTSKRVNWEKELSQEELEPFIQKSFIDKEGWINAQPYLS